MLRLLLCIRELQIPQARLAAFIGWSRAQVSVTLRTGRFPVDGERFRAEVRCWAECEPVVMAWLQERDLGLDALFDVVGVSGPVDLDGVITGVCGGVVAAGVRTGDYLAMVRVARCLLGYVRANVPAEGLMAVEASVAGMLVDLQTLNSGG